LSKQLIDLCRNYYGELNIYRIIIIILQMSYDQAKKDIKGFSEALQKDPSLADALTNDQLEDLLTKHLNPTGKLYADPENEKYAKLSCVEAHKRFQMRFLTTGMIGFLHRYLAEWHTTADEGREDITHSVYLEKMKRFNDLTISEQKRLIVYEFLSSLFHFNPDLHVRKGYYPNAYDPDRKDLKPEIETLEKSDKEKAEAVKAKLAKLPRRRQAPDVKKPEEKKTDESTSAFAPPALSPEQIAINAQIPMELDGEVIATYGMKDGQLIIPPAPTKIVKTNDTDVRSHVIENIPPLDWFYRLEHYMDHNFDALRAAAQDIYPEKPYIDLMFNVYGVFNSKEKAKEWEAVHGKDISMDVQTVIAGGWTVLGSFKQNRETITFDNKKTKILDEMMAQLARDKKVGSELLRKRKDKLKADQVRKLGPDAEEFIKWRSENKSDMDKYDSKTMELTKQYNKESMASEECPDDAVQIDVHIVSDGGKKTTKESIFVEAEEPDEIHMYKPDGAELGDGYVK
jgi:hypothetical protein